MHEDQARWDARWQEREIDFSPPELLVDFAHLLVGGRVLDLACGVGRTALYLAARGYVATAVDISPVALGYGQKEAARRGLQIQFIQADLDSFSLPPDNFDLVCVFNFLNRSLIPQIRESLRPGRLLIYESPNQAHITRHPQFNPIYALHPGELLELFGDWEVDHHEERYEEPPFVSSIVARKPA
ncbi:MAG: class I SAM-dependent methyltransferase [Chloroflexi bacterium]|nr:class I SAM-dependent methyltransferase [Chloroflexota bacterium]